MNAEVLISCQGGDYTTEMYPKLRQAGWKGYWIDAASTLRMADQAKLEATIAAGRARRR